MKRGIFFTIDSLLASGIMIVAILLVSNFYSVQQQGVNVNYASQDLVRIFSAMKVGEVRNDYVKSLIASGDITNINNTILEQIGDFWAEDKIDMARNFTKNLTEGIFPAAYGFSVLVNEEIIYSKDLPVKRALVSSRKIISGISKAKPTEGFTARVLLSGIKSKRTNAYAYFGGYEGDGNLTKKLILPNDVISFNSSYLEVDAGGNFNLYINGFFSGSYIKGSSGGGSMLADKWNISNAYLANFRPGENIIKINFTSGIPYVAGGFLRVAYVTSSYNDTQTPGSEKYLFPGIDGVINLYSSIYVPGALNNMQVFLNYSSVYTIFLKLGNTTVYEENPNGAKNVIISNSTLNSMLNYNLFNQQTMPLRLSIKNATGLGGTADAVLVSDVSGSMDWCSDTTSWASNGWDDDANKGCWLSGNKWYYNTYAGAPTGFVEINRTFWANNSQNYCSCRFHSICPADDVPKVNKYKNASMLFADTLLNINGNKAGLVEFSSSSDSAGYSAVYKDTCSSSSQKPVFFSDSIVRTFDLTSSKTDINNGINTTDTWFDTCICCGVNKGVNMLESQSSSSRNKYIVLMSDGAPNVVCAQQPNTTAIADAVQSAWDACNKKISVYTIAFGSDADTTTLKRMNCSGGKFFNATNATNLQDIYGTIAGEINTISFSEQIVNATGLNKSVLYSNSYIEFNYTAPEIQFNKVPLGFETERFGNNISSGTLTIYPNTSVSDARVTSYSGSKWTDKLVVNGDTVYQLSDFGNDYQILGDPFAVNIPVSNINEGSNSIAISTGINSTASTGGSNDSRVIYTLLLNGFADYSSVVAKSDGCSWTVSFEDGTASTIKVPSTYSGADICSFSTKIYDSNDALDNAVYQLFSNLDIDKDGKLDVNIDSNSLNVNTLTISKVPSLWGPAIIEIRVWE
ncbi:VWA domain-containing protein [Candidatus Woesearchaeota archaeon]|nr:VWA domain-containing protein [Candidatus Woesearchaeota archaeon]